MLQVVMTGKALRDIVADAEDCHYEPGDFPEDHYYVLRWMHGTAKKLNDAQVFGPYQSLEIAEAELSSIEKR